MPAKPPLLYAGVSSPRRVTGVAFAPLHWRIGWTAGYTSWEDIFWFGPLGIMVRSRPTSA